MCFHWQDQEEQAYFAVFDGHGGVDAAIYASIHLHVNLVHQEMFQQDPAEALCRAFRVTDERFVQKAAREVTELPGLDSESIHLSILSLLAGVLQVLSWSRAGGQHRAAPAQPVEPVPMGGLLHVP